MPESGIGAPGELLNSLKHGMIGVEDVPVKEGSVEGE